MIAHIYRIKGRLRQLNIDFDKIYSNNPEEITFNEMGFF
jgi:hypothetical protein